MKVRIVASIAPLVGLTRPMLEQAGISASIETIVPPGVSEHGYEPPPSKLAALAKADVVVIVGLGMEPQVEKFLKDRPNSRRIVVIAADAAGIKADGAACDHDHGQGEGHDHHHHVVDPHFWLDPARAEKVTRAMGKALRGVLADDARAVPRLKEAEESLISKIRDVDGEYQAMMQKAKRKTVVVGHDAWGYLEERYGIEAVAIKGLTASEPTPAALEEAVKAIKEKGATAVLVEPQLSRQAGEKIAKNAGVRVGLIDPLGDGDWLGMMRSNLKEFAKALGADEAALIAPKKE